MTSEDRMKCTKLSGTMEAHADMLRAEDADSEKMARLVKTALADLCISTSFLLQRAAENSRHT